MSENNASIHEVTFPARWDDFDRYGHVNNAVYVEYGQEARLAWAKDMFGFPNAMPVFVRHIEVDYQRPITPDSTEIRVRSEVTKVGNTSFVTRQEILDHAGNVCCTIENVLVAVDLKTATPREITEAERNVLTGAASEEG